MHSQENKLLEPMNQFDGELSQLKYVLNLQIDSILEDGFSKLLKIKLNSDLNNLGDVFAFYADGKELELSRKEQSVLENRVLHFADWFVKNKYYVIIKNSEGSKSGIGVEKIVEKTVITLLISGNDTATDRDKRSEYIYGLFSDKIRNLIPQ